MATNNTLGFLVSHRISGDGSGTLADRDTIRPSSHEGREWRARIDFEHGGTMELRFETMPVWFTAVTERLSEILKLPSNWNSYGARPVDILAAKTVISLLAELGADVKPPGVYPATKGCIALTWNTAGGTLEITAEPSEHLGVYAENARGNQRLDEEDVALPHFFMDIVNKVNDLIPRT